MLRDTADAFEEKLSEGESSCEYFLLINFSSTQNYKFKYFRVNFHTDLQKTTNQPMTNSVESIVISLGKETAEVLGFKTEEQIESALIPLISEAFY